MSLQLLVTIALVATHPVQTVPSPPHTELEERVRIGAIDGDDALTSIAGVTSWGNELYVLLPRESKVRVYDLEGRWRRDFGREGDGPGEFRRAQSISADSEGVRVYDTRRSALIYLTHDGTELRRETGRVIPFANGAGSVRGPMIQLRDGTLAGYTHPANDLATSGESAILPVLRLESGGEIRDTIITFLYANHGSGAVEMPGGRRTAYFSLPIMDAPYYGFSPDADEAVVILRTVEPELETFRVTKVLISGDTVFSVTIPFTPVPVSRSEKQKIAQRYRSETRKAVEAALRNFPHYPPVSGFYLDVEGRVWLAKERLPDEPTTWWLIDRTGEPRLSLKLPYRARVLWAADDEIWVSEQDELDVPYLVKYLLLGKGAS